MRFSASTSILSLLAAGSQAMPTSQPNGLVVPRDQADGSYLVHNWGTRQELHERLQNVPEPDPQVYAAHRSAAAANDDTKVSPNADAPADLFRRYEAYNDVGDWACGCVDLHHGDCDAATRGVEDYTDRFHTVNPGTCFYQKSGSVVAFTCTDPHTMRNSWQAWYVRGQWQRITDKCGWYKAGSSGRRGQSVTGYMTADHKNFQADAWASSRLSC